MDVGFAFPVRARPSTLLPGRSPARALRTTRSAAPRTARPGPARSRLRLLDLAARHTQDEPAASPARTPRVRWRRRRGPGNDAGEERAPREPAGCLRSLFTNIMPTIPATRPDSRKRDPRRSIQAARCDACAHAQACITTASSRRRAASEPDLDATSSGRASLHRRPIRCTDSCCRKTYALRAFSFGIVGGRHSSLSIRLRRQKWCRSVEVKHPELARRPAQGMPPTLP